MTEVIPITNNTTANMIFELINRAERFGDKKIDIIICETKDGNCELWFYGNNITSILEYKDGDDAIRKHVDDVYKIKLVNLYKKIKPGLEPGLKRNEKSKIYINEAGLYQLIFSSKLKKARLFQSWVYSELLPNIRKIGQDKYLQQLQQLQIENKEKDDQLNRLHNTQKELLSYKKRITKTETIYIVSTANYARQGIFKIGRTKNAMKFRSSTHNTTHIKGDKIKPLKEFKVYDCVLVEKNVHTKLHGLLLDGEYEFFMCPYDLLVSIIEMIIFNDDKENEMVNRIIDTVYSLKQKAFNAIDWTSGIPADAFAENMQLVINDTDDTEVKELAKFDVSDATDEQKQEFISECLLAYKRTIQQPTEASIKIVWKAFQGFLITRLSIPKSHFKSRVWRPLVKEEEKNNSNLQIKWR